MPLVGRALVEVLPLAVAIAIFPVPIIAVVLLLAADGGRAKGVAFVLAWFAGLLVVGGLVLLLAGRLNGSEGGERATWIDIILLGLGLLLLAVAVRQWRGRPATGEEPPTPGWMRAIDDFTAAKAGVTGFALAALNPKNLVLTVAAAVEIAAVGLAASGQIAVLLAFALLASLGVLAPLVLSLTLGDRARGPLAGARDWMGRQNAAIMSVLFLLIGAKLIGDAISGLSG